LKASTEQLEDVMFLDLPGRLARALLQLSKNSKPAPRGRRIALTQRHLSEIIGISRERESTNKQLRIWQQQKWILLERGGITILAPDKLAAAATAADE
jgi:CRP/FNR family cyclic AMP-dependent transcriptional regulator